MALTLACLFALLSFLTYSLWGFLNGLVVKNIEPFSGLFYSSLGYFIAGLISLSFVNFQPKISVTGIVMGILLGLATGLGGFFLLLSLQKINNTSMLVTLTALYPVGTILLCYFLLGEALTLRQLIGCIISMTGILIMFL